MTAVTAMAKTDLTPPQSLNLTKAKFLTVTAYSIVFKAIGSKMQATNCRLRQWPSKINFCALNTFQPCFTKNRILRKSIMRYTFLLCNTAPFHDASSRHCQKAKMTIFCSRPMQPYDLDVEFLVSILIILL